MQIILTAYNGRTQSQAKCHGLFTKTNRNDTKNPIYHKRAILMGSVPKMPKKYKHINTIHARITKCKCLPCSLKKSIPRKTTYN